MLIFYYQKCDANAIKSAADLRVHYYYIHFKRWQRPTVLLIKKSLFNLPRYDYEIKGIFLLFRYGLYLKLFMVMGVNWSVELISFVVGGSNWYWIIVDISNMGLGIFVFLIFVWKKKVRNLVQKRYFIFFVFVHSNGNYILFCKMRGHEDKMLILRES